MIARTVTSSSFLRLVEKMKWNAVVQSIPSILSPDGRLNWTPSTTGRLIRSNKSISASQLWAGLVLPACIRRQLRAGLSQLYRLSPQIYPLFFSELLKNITNYSYIDLVILFSQ